MNFREKLRKLRKNKDIKIRELARKSGVSVSYISMLENGLLANDPSPEIIKKIENSLGVERGELLSCANSESTITLKRILSDPESAEKMRKIVEKVGKDKKILDRLLKAAEGK